MAADSWMFALDNQAVGTGAASWCVQVLGVHVDGPEVWVQIARNDDADDAVLLHLFPGATADDALAALAMTRPAATHPLVIEARPHWRPQG